MSRPDLVAKLDPTMPVNTYACYEQGIRPWPLPRLVDACRALDVRVGDVIETALQDLSGIPGGEPAQLTAGDLGLRGIQASLDRMEATLNDLAAHHGRGPDQRRAVLDEMTDTTAENTTSDPLDGFPKTR